MSQVMYSSAAAPHVYERQWPAGGGGVLQRDRLSYIQQSE